MHPAKEIYVTKSKKLSNKKIILGVTGSIAAVETLKLARELIRHGAEVIPVMTNSATKIIHPDVLWFATGKRPIVQLTGETEHVLYCGQKDHADIMLISPCSANTISKIAHGIGDTTVTIFAITAIGTGIPLIIVPAMHISMYKNKIVKQNIEKCKKNGINFIQPKIEKNKAKQADIDEIVSNVIRQIGNKTYSGKKILIIGGPTSESIDDVRVITNRSSGKTAVSLALSAFYQNAKVNLWYGKNASVKPPQFIETKYFETSNGILKMANSTQLNKFDYIFVCAAISDYIPKKQKGKISSDKNKITIELKPTQKIISKIRKKASKPKIIGFKVEEKKDNLKQKSMKVLEGNNLDYIVGNTIQAFDRDINEIWVFNKKGKTFHKKGKKENIAEYILEIIK